MKKILIVTTNFRHGGTNKSLENLLSLIDKKQYKVDVFGMEHYGPYLTMLNNCTILPKNKIIHGLISQYQDTRGLEKLLSLGLKVTQKFGKRLGFNIQEYFFKRLSNNLIRNKKYSAIIAFNEGSPTYFLNETEHSNKIAWVHCDYSSYLKLNNRNELNIYDNYKSIVCVSNYTLKKFEYIFPTLLNKIHSIHNIINIEEIYNKSNVKLNDNSFYNKKFTILSVGRIDIVKNFIIIPKIVSELKLKNIEFVWYLIGPKGIDKVQKEFEENIKKYNVHNEFKWLGPKENPYQYMANSDLLVMTSKSEACPYVLNEAKVLKLPIITTNYGSAFEFISDNINGIICTEEQLSQEIIKLISNPAKIDKLKENLEFFKYDNEFLMQKIYNLLN